MVKAGFDIESPAGEEIPIAMVEISSSRHRYLALGRDRAFWNFV
jgi:hypothetical protein